MVDIALPRSQMAQRLLLGLSIVLIIAGAVGTLGISAMLAFLLPQLTEGLSNFFMHQALFQMMWAVFFISLMITGISLMISVLRHKAHDLIPGLTLYFLGAALVVNGLLMLVYGQWLYATLAILVGAIVIYLEWSTEAI